MTAEQRRNNTSRKDCTMPEEVDAMQPLRHTLPPDGRREFAEEQPQQRDDGASVDHPSTETPNVGGGAGGSRNRFRRLLSLMASPLTDETGSLISVVVGMCTLIAVGAAIGLALPKNPALPTVAYRSVSAAIGWVYFLAWSVSFYPQLISNWKRRSTVGLSPDFCVLNVLGFACYAAYNVAFFWSTTIQDLYRKRHGEDAEITVQANDVAFALHAFLLSSITVLQILYYGGGLGALRLSKPIQWVIVAIFVVCTMYTVLVADFTTTQIRNDTARRYHDDSIGRFNWLDFLYLLSFVKIGISLIKYIPQVILNYRRKSTVGWSIWNILLDFTGGVLSDLQLVLDCADLNDFGGITGNPAKFGLGFVSIIFDVIFMMQHYCLYADSTTSAADSLIFQNEQEEPLLPTSIAVVENSDDDGTGPEMIMV